jgi:hypothetical protein
VLYSLSHEQLVLTTALLVQLLVAALNTTLSQRHVSNAQLVKLVIMSIKDVLSRLKTATMQIKFNWVKINAMHADNALLDRHSTDSPTLATSKLL